MVKTNNQKKKKKMPKPLAPLPQMKSRKRARIVTTLFHKHTRLRDEALERGDLDTAQKLEQEISNMGGREEYQRASQLSTSFFSTSKWVLRSLSSPPIQWLHQGIEIMDTTTTNNNNNDDDDNNDDKKKKKKKALRRNVKLLEIGAINTELLDAAAKTRTCQAKQPKASSEDNTNTTTTATTTYVEKPLYRLHVRAIDLRSSHDGIEEVDFLSLEIDGTYDVLVCSMVLNCVTSASDRGKMLALMYHQLRPGGFCFFTVPKLCLNQSPYMTTEYFQQVVTEGVGFTIHQTKESPKVAFYILQRPSQPSQPQPVVSGKFQTLRVLKRGKKYRNQFSILLHPDEISGKAFGLTPST